MGNENLAQDIQTFRDLAEKLTLRIDELTEAERAAIAAALPPSLVTIPDLKEKGNEESRRLQAENQRQKALLEAIFEADPGALAVLAGDDLRYAYVNPAYRYLIPDPTQELLDQPYDRVWPNQGEIAYKDRFIKVLQTGQPFQANGIEHRFPDGTSRVLTVQARRIEWESKPAVLVILWDITESKRAKQELQAVHNRLVEIALFPEEDPNPVARVLRNGSVIYRNPAARRVPGWNLEIGDPVPNRINKVIEQALRSQSVIQQDVPLADRIYSVTIAPVPTKGYVNVYGQDITERKKAEKTLLANETRIRELLESIRDGFMQLDRNWRFTYVNRQAASNVGYEPRSLIGKNLFEMFPMSRGSEHERVYREVMETRQPAEFTDQGTLTSKWYDIRVYPSQEGISVFWVDITDRKKNEEEALRQANQIELQRQLLEQREQERLRIARDLHDGPVQEILGAMYALYGMLNGDGASNLNGRLKGVADTLGRQVVELRNYAGELRPPALSKFGLEKAIRGHVETLREKYPDIQISIEARQEGELLPEEMRVALFRIYQEAMNNIVKHSPKSKVKIIFEKEDHEARLEISDNGPGFEVPQDWLEFARAGHLGLVGMRERAAAIGGEVEIDSKPGQETCIRVTVPIPGDSLSGGMPG